MLVGVLKRKRDLDILLRERWYRMPVRRGPVRRFDYLALYEPAWFGKSGKRIRYYARAAAREVVRRERMLPDEPRHPRAQEAYWRVRLRGVQKLPRP
ncbi:MAG: hypothetical protein KGJ13_08665, partial [Patescibacteria group bacterium]|nr:hypothetical protein [Patescibacteria group bacterium]